MPNETHRLWAARTARARSEARVVRAPDEDWRVYEAEHFVGDRRGSLLVFDSDKVVRTVRGYPTDWRLCTDEQLMLISWRI
jgi:hypothetical protein